MSLTSLHPALLASLLTVTAGCGPLGGAEIDCVTLGGGYEGEDLEAIQAECEADSLGTDCDASAFIESDVAKCLSLAEWSEDVARERTARLGYLSGDRTVVWVIDDPDSHTAAKIHATTGEGLGSIYYQPQ
jgi:hypothetical protein